MAVTEASAHRQNDNYAIVCTETDQCVGVEHNPSEAKALATFLTNRSGNTHHVEHNGPDAVRQAKAIRPTLYRHPLRDEAFEALGVDA